MQQVSNDSMNMYMSESKNKMIGCHYLLLISMKILNFYLSASPLAQKVEILNSISPFMAKLKHSCFLRKEGMNSSK